VADSDENTSIDSIPPAARGGPWKLIAVVAVATLVAILLVPGEQEAPPLEELPPLSAPEQSPLPDKGAPGQPQLPPLSAPERSPLPDKGAQPQSLRDEGRDSPPWAPPTETTAAPPAIQAGAEPATKANTPGRASQKPAAASTATGPLPPGAAARRLIAFLRSQSPLDLERAFAAAQAHQAKGRIDDAYLLYFFAAREGHGLAAMALGQQADPAYFSEAGLFKRADEMQAYKWYTQAKLAGIEKAGPSLAALRQRLADTADAGDERARRILLQWK